MNRRLTRSADRMIGGVAGGVATWLNADPALIRIAWAILVPLTGGIALLAYIVAWVVVPEASGEADGADATPEKSARPAGDGRVALVLGGGLILVGLWFLLREFLPAIDWGLAWPVVLIGVGILVLFQSRRNR